MWARAAASLWLALMAIGAATGSQFTYDNGGEDWPDTFPHCGGFSQSPINIDTENVVQICGDDNMRFNDDDVATIRFRRWGTAEGEGENKGQNFEAVLSDPTTKIKMPCVGGHVYGIVQVDDKKNDDDVDYVDATPLQFHFHTPSENTIDGKHFPLEVHLVASIDPDDADCGYAEDGSKISCLVVFATLFDYDEFKNDFVAHIFDEDVSLGIEGIDQETYGNWAVTDVNGTTIHGDAVKKHLGTLSLSDMVPNSMDFYYWDGSLTTPPCDEIVTWIVFQEIQGVTPDQIQQLTTNFGENNRYCLFQSEAGDVCQCVGNLANNRPTRDLGTRIVYSSIPKDCDDSSSSDDSDYMAEEEFIARTRL
ncbi:unnamed protein product [Ostreobium quekettii]|uniref:Carbonic anhydrase n=1 Tax=Ostreobium quekettii TaxID=121088 RepID=A0A8S1IVT9_9CHLO|nr:unnamed protein product [Ostreobium quekettii]